jgi:hypothetical protein
MTLGGLGPGIGTTTDLYSATNPKSAKHLSLALGGDGTAPVNTVDGISGVDPDSPPPTLPTEISLGSNMSAGVTSELFGALGGTGVVDLFASDGISTIDPSGVPPTQGLIVNMWGSTGVLTEGGLLRSIGGEASGTANENDGVFPDDLGGDSPSEETVGEIGSNVSEDALSELNEVIASEPLGNAGPSADAF